MRIPLKYLILKALLAGIAIYLLVDYVEWSEIQAAALSAHTGWIWAALALLPLNVGLHAWRWHTILKRVIPKIAFKDSLGAVLSGYALGSFTPGRVGDYVGRMYYIKHENKGELGALTFADNLIALFTFVGAGVLALFYFAATNSTFTTLQANGLMILSVIWLFSLGFCLVKPGVIFRWIVPRIPSKRLRGLLASIEKLNRRDAVILFGQSWIRFCVFSTQFLFLIWAFVPETSALYAYVGIILTFFAKTVIPDFTLAELGIREGAAIFFLGFYGIPEAVAFNAAFLLFAINILIPALVGIPYVFRMNLGPDTPPLPTNGHAPHIQETPTSSPLQSS